MQKTSDESKRQTAKEDDREDVGNPKRPVETGARPKDGTTFAKGRAPLTNTQNKDESESKGHSQGVRPKDQVPKSKT